MIFKATTLPPEGRNKYGNYLSSTNVNKSVVMTTYYGDDTTSDLGGGQGGNQGNTPVEEQENWLLFLSKTNTDFDGMVLSVADLDDETNVIGYRGSSLADTYVGKIDTLAAQTNYSIVGLPASGMTVTVTGNGTKNTKIKIAITKDITARQGSLQIPCAVYRKSKDGEALGDDISAWNDLQNECTQIWLEYTWSINAQAGPAFTLELTNDNASINCDKNGNILAGAVRPTCQAQLYYGDSAVTATYGLSYPSTQSVVGVSINTSTGVLTFGSNFNFQGTPLELTITGTYQDRLVGKAIMTISKAYPGTDGVAVSRWIVLSADSVKVDTNVSPNVAIPASITAKVMEQRNEQAPVEVTDNIFYGFNSNPTTRYTGAVTVDVTKDYLTFGLRNATNDWYELETVSILKDGKNGTDGQPGAPGEPGPRGLKGASIRGPVDWYKQETTRRFCNGTGEEGTEDSMWIDVILKDGKYYYCNLSYTGSAKDDWNSVKANWTEANEKFDFIATKILLADNAGIKFLSSNQITLLADNGTTIVGGAMGGSGTIFWAGAETPSNAPYRVNYDGSIYAKSGVFAGYIQMPYTFISDLPHNADGYLANEKAYLIADETSGSYGMGHGGVLILPNPDEAHNGFTYHIIVKPNIATKSSGQNPGLSVRSSNSGKNIAVYALATSMGTSSVVSFYGGHVEITCAPYHVTNGVEYRWIVTQCTGGVDFYESTGTTATYVSSYTPVCGYSTQGNYYTINKIKADEVIPSTKEFDTFYISRT